jgi:hypothetical protein
LGRNLSVICASDEKRLEGKPTKAHLIQHNSFVPQSRGYCSSGTADDVEED